MNIEQLEQNILSEGNQDIDVFHYERHKKQYIDVWGYKEEDLLILANKMAIQYKQDALNKTKPLADATKELNRLETMDKFAVQRSIALLKRFCELSTKNNYGRNR